MVELQESSGCFYKKKRVLAADRVGELRRDGKKKRMDEMKMLFGASSSTGKRVCWEAVWVIAWA